MKHTLFIFLLFFVAKTALAQAPQKFNFQAVARDAQGDLIANQNIRIRTSILDGSVNGTSQYTETHNATTNQLGLFTLPIGGGSVVNGSFFNITWSSGDKYIKIEMDAAGGNNFMQVGTSQLLSVPYAVYAEKTNIVPGNGIAINNNVISNTGDLSANNELQTLTLSGNTLSISNGNSVTLSGGGSSQPIAPTYSTTQILNLSNPATGSIVLNSDDNALYYFSGANWYKLDATILANPGAYVVTDCLVAYYNFDDSTPDDVQGDYEGINNGCVFSTDVNDKINSGKSVTMDGTDRITVPTNPLYNLTQGSISYWYKGTAGGAVLTGSTQNNSSVFQIRTYANLGANRLLYNGGVEFNYDITPFLNGAWNHFVVTISATEHKLYVNGMLLETKSNNNGMSGTSTNNGMLIGAREGWPTWSLVGKLDNLRIFCKALTSDEVNLIYNSGQ